MAVDDLVHVIERWRYTVARTSVREFDSAAWLQESDITAFATECISKAEKPAVAESESPVHASAELAQFCLVAKQPHICNRDSAIAVASRLLAFGAEIGEIRELSASGGTVARTLYPAAHRYFTGLPDSPAVWAALAARFDNDDYESIFGRRYSPASVVCGAQALAETGLTAAELTQVWEEGRQPISARTVRAWYGAAAADVVVGGGADSYPWFRGPLPLGIQRLSSGVVAFALRHERIRGGAPVIVLNGHFPGLAELFDRAIVIEAGLPAAGPGISQVRRWVVGDDNRPGKCAPGTIRRDAVDGVFRGDSDLPVDSRRNLIHCSDGLLAGLIECQTLLRRPDPGGALTARLRARGLTGEEIHGLVAADPLIRVQGTDQRLTALTRGQQLEECADTIIGAVPPVFGAANGFANGVTFSGLGTQLQQLVGRDQLPVAPPPVRPLGQPVLRRADLAAIAVQAGLGVIGAGGAALVVPVAGTGGRFGGYDVPESHRSRQKAMLPVFTVGGRARSSLDIRLANAAYWRHRTGGRLPVAVMAGPTNVALAREWCADVQSAGVPDLSVYQQHGAYRIRADAPAPAGDMEPRWIDRILRREDGSPDLKPAGNLGMLTCLVLSGLLESWAAGGVEYLVIANGDDVAFRIEPGALGVLAGRPELDAIVGVVPWRLRGHLMEGSDPVQIRGDVSGWCVADSGEYGALRPVPSGGWQVTVGDRRGILRDPRLESGGKVCERWTPDGWRAGVVEVRDPAPADGLSLFSTNQMYLRVAAVQRALELAAGQDVVDAVRRFVSAQPFSAERKRIASGDRQEEALQVSQGVHEVLRHLQVAALSLAAGGYAPLKHPQDTVFAQIAVDDLARSGDALLFP